MKLDHCVSQAPAFSEEDFLRAENDFLRDELELREQEHTLEIYETILDCIQKEGSVSKSLEVMFGENVSSMSNFEAEMKAQYEAALEGMFDFIKNIGSNIREGVMFSAQAKKAKELSERAKKVMDKIRFPIEVELHGIEATLRSAVLMIQHGSEFESKKFNEKPNEKTLNRIQRAIGAALINERNSNISEFIKHEERGNVVWIDDAKELARLLDSMAHHSRLSISEDMIKHLLDEVKKNVGVDAKYWADYDDKKIKRLNDILLRGLVKTNMQTLRAIEIVIDRAEEI